MSRIESSTKFMHTLKSILAIQRVNEIKNSSKHNKLQQAHTRMFGIQVCHVFSSKYPPQEEHSLDFHLHQWTLSKNIICRKSLQESLMLTRSIEDLDAAFAIISSNKSEGSESIGGLSSITPSHIRGRVLPVSSMMVTLWGEYSIKVLLIIFGLTRSHP